LVERSGEIVDDSTQQDLFSPPPRRPSGFEYRENVISTAEEAELVARFCEIEFTPFEFRGFLGKRRVASFGWKYDFNRARLDPAPSPPDFLIALRRRIAVFENDAGLFDQVSIAEYTPGAGIGWHRDKPQFGEVTGLSLLGHCRFRMRLSTEDSWMRSSPCISPRSVYRLTGPARWEWEHSIPPVETLRYSITFRRLA
jgi:alkylated DNA repair dioxygenase AlkB